MIFLTVAANHFYWGIRNVVEFLWALFSITTCSDYNPKKQFKFYPDSLTILKDFKVNLCSLFTEKQEQSYLI